MQKDGFHLGKSLPVNLSLGNAEFQTTPMDPRPLLSSGPVRTERGAETYVPGGSPQPRRGRAGRKANPGPH